VTVSASDFKSDFDTFLFASIGEDGNGMQVSVLSALSRLGLDPWLEAAELARLSGTAAIEKLTLLIQTLPSNAGALPDARSAAARLLGLLPGSAARNAGPGQTPANLAAVMKSQPWMVYLLFISFILGSQILIASRQSAPATHNVAANSLGEATPPAPSASEGQ
jgi:hypothetical protein